MHNIFEGLFDSSTITVAQFSLCLFTALVMGLILSLTYSRKAKSSKSFNLTLALIPAVVCVIIMMVNGNVGAGVAVAGAFSLVRFRSAAGTAKEIGAIFIGMGSGLMIGMGYLGYGALFTVVMCLMFLLYSSFLFDDSKQDNQKLLNITIPENLDYTGVFDDLLEEYTTSYKILNVKSTNMGSLFKLTIDVTQKDLKKEKEFIDKIRQRNGNLEVSLSYKQTKLEEL